MLIQWVWDGAWEFVSSKFLPEKSGKSSHECPPGTRGGKICPEPRRVTRRVRLSPEHVLLGCTLRAGRPAVVGSGACPPQGHTAGVCAGHSARGLAGPGREGFCSLAGMRLWAGFPGSHRGSLGGTSAGCPGMPVALGVIVLSSWDSGELGICPVGQSRT